MTSEPEVQQPESPIVAKLKQSFDGLWEKALTQPSSVGNDLPVDHFFPTMLASTKLKYQIGLKYPDRTTISKEEVKDVVKSALLFLKEKGEEVGEDQWESMQNFWRKKPGRMSRNFGGREIALLLGEKGQLWDPFVELEITDRNMFDLEKEQKSALRRLYQKRFVVNLFRGRND